MTEFHGSASAAFDATPDALFLLVTDLDRLPEWNAAIERVVDRPTELVPGAQWVVVMHPAKLPRWNSRSTLLELDRDARRFAHRTQSDDNNPSYAVWTWSVEPDGTGARLSVSWDCHPKTSFRRVFGPRVRGPQLQREVPASLTALAELAQRLTP
jgi:uncharacterized protein YndB with AHSA1/START domain